MEKSEVKLLFEKLFEEVKSQYPTITKPYLKIYNLWCGCHGSYVPGGFGYSKFQPVIRINLYHQKINFEHTILHELCHLINHQVFEHEKAPHHNKKFWELCKQFNLPINHSSYKISKKMMKIYGIKSLEEITPLE